MTAPFDNRRRAALALINNAMLNVREAGFVGQMTVAASMSEKQARWFEILLEKHGLPPLAEDAQ
jgi:hypothetical protein